ncbi:reticulon-like protein B8 [Trifolium pratense]|uniref:Reticulon-like protein n=1 Tax=Trifolium pratense TaxID=57577 RepID=A0A2K3P7R0_TRIPR|nr:reticulon-like protein B8 [Trifolium pratense]
MSEKTTAEKLLNTLVETLEKQKSGSFFEKQNSGSFFEKQKSGSFFEKQNSGSFFEKQNSGSFFEDVTANSMTSQFNKLFGREKPVHHILGGGKSADVLLWRNKKISASVLTAATAIWVLFEWLNYNFLSLLFLALVLVLSVQFLWTNASTMFSRKPSKAPRLVLPEDLFANIATAVGTEVNRGLRVLQNVSCGGNLKQFVLAVVGLWAGAVLGSWCNFLTVMYIGFVAAHTLPVLYEKYDDQIDNFVYKVIDQMQTQYKKVDSGLLSKIPKGNIKEKKVE